MKKCISALSIALLFSVTGIAQTKNVDIDNEWFTYSYRVSPTQPRDPVFFYYTTDVVASSVAKNNISIDEIADALFIEGQRKTDNQSDALLSIELTLGNIVISNSEVLERKVESKDRDGKITGVTYYFWVSVAYTFEASFVGRSNNEILAKATLFSRDAGLNYASKEFSKRKDAADYWNNNREVLISDFYRDLSLKAAVQASSTLSSLFGFRAIKGAREIIKITDEKKHNENENFRAAAKALKDELQAMTPDTPINRVKANDLIAYFKSIPEKYTDPKSKADSNLRYAAYYNLCRIYLFLDEPENVNEWADLIFINGVDKKDCDKLKKEAETLNKTFETTGVKTRHFDPETYFPD